MLAGESIEADVVAHAAWHHLAARAFAPSAGGAAGDKSGRPREALSAIDTLFLGEAIASAFDVYLVGRLLGHAPRSTFLETPVPAMAETASAAGLSERAFAALLADLARRPERAFEDLRELLCDATAALFACRDGEESERSPRRARPTSLQRPAPSLRALELGALRARLRSAAKDTIHASEPSTAPPSKGEGSARLARRALDRSRARDARIAAPPHGA